MTGFYTKSTLAALLLGAVTGAVGAETPTPLKEAVKALNQKTENGYFARDVLRTPPLAKDRQPTAVTPDEVVAVIRGWDRKKVPVADATYRIYEEIAESKTLPPGASLGFQETWVHPGGRDKYEYRVWRVTLEVMTSKNAGYGFVIREQRLDRRIALLAAPEYSWLQGPTPLTPLFNGWSGSEVVMFEEDTGAAGEFSSSGTARVNPTPGAATTADTSPAHLHSH